MFDHDFESRLRHLESIGSEEAWFGVGGGSMRRRSVRSGNSAIILWYVGSTLIVLMDATSSVAANLLVDSCVVVSRNRLFRGSTSNPEWLRK